MKNDTDRFPAITARWKQLKSLPKAEVLAIYRRHHRVMDTPICTKAELASDLLRAEFGHRLIDKWAECAIK